jgi:penicillin G amidase
MRITKAIISLVVAIALSGCAVCALVSYKISPDFPATEGIEKVRGTTSPVRIVRDEYGMPHIFAENLADAVFGQGYAAGADRLWQMNLLRTLARGRVSELAGAKALKIDRLYRTLGMGVLADKEYCELDPQSRTVFEAFASGINAFAENHPELLEVEFKAAGLEFEPWSAADSLAVLYFILWNFSANWQDEILLSRLAAKLGEEQALSLLPEQVSGPGRVIYSELQNIPGLENSPVLAAALEIDGYAGYNGGSNNWVIGPSLTASGKPVLANDPHISGANLPSMVYASHMSIPGADIIGTNISGIPGIIMGSNGHVAFGLTNNYADVTDLYIETLVEGKTDSYIFRGEERKFEIRREVIKVKGGEDVVLEVKSTVHGPIVSDLYPELNAAVSLKWTLFEPGASAGFVDLLLAKNADQLMTAAAKVSIVPQNLVYADEDGNFGFAVMGRVPKRNGTYGILPTDGASGDYEWDGYIPFDEKPQVHNPPEGYVVTANNRVTGEDYPYYWAAKYSPPFRKQRIAEMIRSRKGHTAEYSHAMMTDFVSRNAEKLVAHAVSVIEPRRKIMWDEIQQQEAEDRVDETLQTTEAKLQRFVDILEIFDGTMYKGDIGPTVYHNWIWEVARLIFSDDLGELTGDYLKNQYMSQPLVSELIMVGGPWCDKKDTPQPETCDDLIVEAAEITIARLYEELGDDITEWRWGNVHTINFKSPSASDGIAARIFSYGPFPMSGDGETVMRAGYPTDHPFHVHHIAAMRMAIDLADPTNIPAVISTGTSDRLDSPHYHDQADLWLEGKWRIWQTDREEIMKTAEGELTLLPQN